MSALLTTPDGTVTTGRTASQTLGDLEHAVLRIPLPPPFATRFHPLDEVLSGGIRAGHLLLVGGKPGQGKTIAALQWARHMAKTGSIAIVACYEHDEVTLVTRLLSCELGEVVAQSPELIDELRLERLREDLRADTTGTKPIRDVLDADPLLSEAEARLHTYGEDLVFVRASGTRADVRALHDLVDSHGGSHGALRRLHPEGAGGARARPGGGAGEAGRRGAQGAGAPEARRRHRSGGRRRRRPQRQAAAPPAHARSTALAYESDAAVLLNDKMAVVSKSHLAYDTTRAAELRRHVVFSVEKNRNGSADVELEFEKDFANYRFVPAGRWVVERLWEEGCLEE